MSKFPFLGQELVDLSGQRYTAVGINEGSCRDLVRLREVDGKREILVSAYELKHYYNHN